MNSPKSFLIIIFLLYSFLSLAQLSMLQEPSSYEIEQAPQWAKEMYSANPNVVEVDALYSEFYRGHIFEKNFHTQYYKRWRIMIGSNLNEDGTINLPSSFDLSIQQQQYEQKINDNVSRNLNWQLVGPLQVYNDDASISNDHTNVYCLDQSATDPNILFCGTEPGEIYKSTDGGVSWIVLSDAYGFGSIGAIEIDPINPDVIYAGGGAVWKSIDGGTTWNNILNDNSFWSTEILVNPSNPQIVLVTSYSGLYRSTDGGTSFTQLAGDECYDVKLMHGNNAILYLVKNNDVLIRSEFFKSIDYGATWTLKDNGWYLSTDPDRIDFGARLAVSPADPNRVYAYPVGEAKAGDIGFIGVYRSDDGGENWILPNGPPGGPYTSSHPNLARGWEGWDYHQGFYNCALLASSTDADQLLIGGLNLWRSDDGGYTFSVVGGYLQGTLSLHPDVQDVRETSAGTWVTNDGGIMISNDFFHTNMTHMAYGVHGTDYWGFGLGWNEEVMVGGAYHNGNTARTDNYGTGEFMQLGGGEASTGYVNPGRERTVYCSDLGTVKIPETIGGGSIIYSGLGLSPNESYWAANSSEMEFWPSCYNHIFLGNENKLWKSTDGGGAFNVVNEFGTNIDARVQHIEISRSNNQVMYVSQKPASGATGFLWKTDDGMNTWNQLTIPSAGSGGWRDRIILSLSATNEDSLWMAYPGAANGNKVFLTPDGGTTWLNLTTSMLDNEEVRYIIHQEGTNGGIYAFTNNAVYYRNNTMSDWVVANPGLPLYANCNIAHPFYRDGKIILATYGKGIYESEFYEPYQGGPIAQPTVDKLFSVCNNDTFYFNDYSILNHNGASWNWTFQNGTPATSTLRNPKVLFSSSGIATLTVTDANGNSDTKSISISITGASAVTIQETFETVFPPIDWTTVGLNSGTPIWAQTNEAGGYGLSTNSARADNYWNDLQGGYGDLRAFVDLSNVNESLLTFDVAYSQYSSGYSDTLEVLASTDCGATFTSLYFHGGDDLATAPDYQSDRFVPTNSQWRTDSVDLNAFLGEELVMIAFRNHGYWGSGHLH